MIAFDRYNVIVKGISGKPLTNGKALIEILCVWLFSLAWCLAPFFGWVNDYPQTTNYIFTNSLINYFYRDVMYQKEI